MTQTPLLLHISQFSNDFKSFVEAVAHLSLPLKGQVSGGHDECSGHKPSQFQFLEQQARHDRLSGSGVISQEEADPWQGQDVVVDRLQLMGERIHTSNGEGKAGVVFVGEG